MPKNRASIHGNFGYAGRGINDGGSTQGFGIQTAQQATGYVSVAGKAGESKYIPANAVLTFAIDQGVWFQAVGSAVDVEFTLEPQNYAMSEEANKNNLVHWCNKQTVSPDTIVPADIYAFSALKVTFTADGIFYVCVR